MASILKVDQIQSDTGTVNLASNLAFSSAFSMSGPLTLNSPTIVTPTMTGQAVIPSINLTSGQITFPASQNASSDANTLDDYEEGTWTPAFIRNGSNPTVTYTSRDGKYTKIGNIVTVSFRMRVSSWSGGSGEFQISGLPFTSNNAGNDHVGVSTLGYESFVFSSSQQLITILDHGVTYIRHLVSNSGSGWGTISDPGSGASCYGCFTYHTS